jgi:ribonuclease HI
MNQPALPFEGDGDEDRLADVTVFSDGGARGNPGPAAIGAVVLDTSTEPPQRLATVSEAIGVTTNNVAEYRALIAGLRAAAGLGAREVEVRADSQLLLRQMTGAYRVKNAALQALWLEARRAAGAFERVRYVEIPRAENAAADLQVNLALDAAAP